MKKLNGRPILGGRAEGPALLTRKPINFTASFTKPANLIPGWQSRINDRHHELFRRNIRNSVLVFPSAIGSTYTGMVLLDVIQKNAGPAAMIVEQADSLLISGSILANIWFKQAVPVVEMDFDRLLKVVQNGDRVSVNGYSGEISIDSGKGGR